MGSLLTPATRYGRDKKSMKILGISCYYHDAAAALIDDGVAIAAAAEERLSRIKHDSSFPKKSINFCLEKAKIKADDLDYVVFYEKPFLKFERITLTSLATAPGARGMFVDAYKSWLKSKLWIKSQIASELKIPPTKILFSQHHVSHAAAAFYTSPFKTAALLTIDGVGEWTTTAWGNGEANKITLNNEIRFPHSIGLFYSAITQFLGFQINEGEFKVMGLSPYGKPKYVNKLRQLINQSADGSFKLNLKYFNYLYSDKVAYSRALVDLLGMEPLDPKKSDQVIGKYADVAASAQAVLDESLLKIAKHVQNVTNEDNLCYSGGVALNGVANWKILKSAGFKNIFIHPAAGDDGAALGGALYVYHHILGNKKRHSLKTAYLGAQNSQSDIKNFLTKNKIKAQLHSDKELVEAVATLLFNKAVVGWCRGRFEWGPRALGARSILADPRSIKMKDLVNSKIKFREAFRPFAPVTLYEEGSKYFDTKGAQDQQLLQYMLAVVPVQQKYKSKLGAITHVDGTARPQFIKREINPLYYDVIKSFGKKSGINVLLNTSFNLKGEPIVNTCEDAHKTFMNSGIDALVLGNCLIRK